jgi:outer membrane protein assembly factor BamB
VVGLDLERLAVTWTHPCRNMVSDAPAFAGGRVFAGPQLDAFRALDGASGAELWRADEHAASSPRVAGSAVYVGTWFGLSCLDAATGKLLWKHSPGGRVLTPWVERGTVYAASERNTLVALAR